MSGESLHARVERESVAPGLFRVRDQPIEEPTSLAFRTRGFMRDEIIDIKKAAIIKRLGDSEARDRLDRAVLLEENQSITGVPPLTSDPA